MLFFWQNRVGDIQRSIWAVKGLLLKGCCWHVGDGKSISIWNASWLLGDQPYIVQSPRVNGIVNVANLIDERYGIWKEDVVNRTFLEHEARRILSRLLNNNIRERLDRGVANPLWWDMFMNFSVQHKCYKVKLALNMEADKEELFWEQQARANWLRMGDRNTAFFHNLATQRKRRNTIKILEDGRGG
ncbi:reverse transcriptase [Gossypium australe]|uniref:Reverse transcriptase n=1 Tax=Gossypium australe TaxID=47621 RepID=A0A5B6W975_9ROSI|nr:reverse transcriptase [Gossypium australe]